MSDSKRSTGGCIIPSLRYRNAPAAIDWLCEAFGFEKHLVVDGEGGTIDHAQLTLGNGMIMLGSAREDDFGAMVQPPSSPDGVLTQSPYVIVHEIDGHYRRAVAAGATVVTELAEQDYGGKLYSCRDPEGHLWNFGSYDPWAEDGGASSESQSGVSAPSER